jgi:hypothetical protein
VRPPAVRSQPVLWCQLLAEIQEYASQPSQPPGI